MPQKESLAMFYDNKLRNALLFYYLAGNKIKF